MTSQAVGVEQEQKQTPPPQATTKKLPAPAKREPKQLPPFKVLLHNDNVNTFEHVILSILKVTTLTAEEAVERTLEAHNSGLALLLVTHLERAELYRDQFATFKIAVTIEPAE
ncbi:MAG: ATP-dependent Clp protease adaptor ClpS [Planctomycetota bacterium]